MRNAASAQSIRSGPQAVPKAVAQHPRRLPRPRRGRGWSRASSGNRSGPRGRRSGRCAPPAPSGCGDRACTAPRSAPAPPRPAAGRDRSPAPSATTRGTVPRPPATRIERTLTKGGSRPSNIRGVELVGLAVDVEIGPREGRLHQRRAEADDGGVEPVDEGVLRAAQGHRVEPRGRHERGRVDRPRMPGVVDERQGLPLRLVHPKGGVNRLAGGTTCIRPPGGGGGSRTRGGTRSHHHPAIWRPRRALSPLPRGGCAPP